MLAQQITVVGTGTWGTTLAMLLARKGLETSLWCRTEEEARQLNGERCNAARLPDVTFPDSLRVTSSLVGSVAQSSVVLLVVPSQMMRLNARLLRSHLRADALVLSCTKGIELDSSLRMSEVLAEELPEAKDRLAVLSGPNLAREIAAGRPATSVVAAANTSIASRLRDLLITPNFRVYSNRDVVGIELAGALKNIIAIGAGMCDGLEVGDNAKAAFISRGLIEITRLGVAAGAQPLTFAGLAGLGDVIATCASRFSRNRTVGEALARGAALEDVQRSLQMVAEGVFTTIAACNLARLYDIEMPITELIFAVLFEQKDPRMAIQVLMTRDPKDEFAGIESYSH